MCECGSRPLACEEGLEGVDRFLGPHPFAEQGALLIDPLDQLLRRQLQQLARNGDGFGGEGADFTRDLARLGFGVSRRDDGIDEAGFARLAAAA